MTVRLDYGRGKLAAEIPDGTPVLSMRAVSAAPDARAEVRRALDDPIGTPPLREIARGRRDAVIVVCDVTRPVPNPDVLPELLADLAEAGIPASKVTILVATGTHRPNDEAELRRMLGDEAFERCPVVNHFCEDDEAMVELGVSPHGIPVRLNRAYVDADLKITLGMIEPHFMAGYAGGRKMVMPGVAALSTVAYWHAPRFLEHPNATNGVVEGNPVHESCLAVTRMCPPDFSVDTALSLDKRLVRAFAGHFERAWEAGVAFVRDLVTAEIPEPVDAVLTTCGGHPLDLTFYQTVKGMVGALPILKRNGTIIIASECAEGVGNDHFRDALLREENLDGFVEKLESPEWTFVPDQWQIEELAKAVRGRRVIMVSALDPELVRRLHVEPASSVEAALATLPIGASLVAIPKGPYVLPVLAR